MARLFRSAVVVVISGLLVGAVALAGGPVCESGAPPRPTVAKIGRAPSSTTKSTNGMIIIPIDPALASDALRASGYEVKSTNDPDDYDVWSEPSPHLRDRLFAEAKLRPYLARFDHFNKDILFLRAQEVSLTLLTKRYPKIPRHVLATLQQLIDGEKRARR